MATTSGRTLAQQRHGLILDEIRRRGGARVAELADLLDVSDMTVRRDLDVLADAGLVTKVHGGATMPDHHSAEEPGFEAKSLRNTDEKSAIARVAAGLVTPGLAIGITAGRRRSGSPASSSRSPISPSSPTASGSPRSSPTSRGPIAPSC